MLRASVDDIVAEEGSGVVAEAEETAKFDDAGTLAAGADAVAEVAAGADEVAYEYSEYVRADVGPQSKPLYTPRL